MGRKSRDYVEGATSSLNLTISAIMKHLKDEGWRPGPKDGGYRDFLLGKIGDLTVKAYKKGFSRGHRESHEVFQKTGEVPHKLKSEVKRTLAPRQKRKIRIKSSLPGK